MDRLLLVDDEPMVLQALRRLFVREGFEVTTTTSPVEAVQLLEKGPPYQLIISDYRMPEMNGAELFEKARDLAPDACRMLISGSDDIAIAMDGINRGEIHRLVRKPWQRDELLPLVRAALEEQHLRRRYQEVTALLHERNAALEALNSSLERKLAERTAHLFDAMVAALDLREAGSSGGSLRVARWSRRIAEELGLPVDQLPHVERGALLHDLGKIGISDEILQKTGKLTPAEWAQLRLAPELGYRILVGVPFLAEERAIVLEHRERWDGAGYPLGLRGEQIRIGARIFHVADAYGAMVRDRPFSPRRSHEEARLELQRCAGTQFDPAVVAAFCRISRGEWEALAEAADRDAHGGKAALATVDLDELRRRALEGRL